MIKKKSKTTAIILAIFFNFFTYIYTWKKNSDKFWTIVTIIFAIEIINATFNLTSSMLTGITMQITWVYCLIDNIIKKEDFYKKGW